MQTILISNLFVFLFLGFCALIVVMQVLPALTTMIGMFKGLVNDKKEILEVK